nr:unnamed protein product [Digitaria exilis]
MAPPSPPAGTNLFLYLLLLFVLTAAVAASAAAPEEEFTEELLLRPLPDRKALAHFYFRSSAPPAASVGRHHHLFPKAISQLGFLHIDEYPPDANQGFDIPSALVSFPELNAARNYPETDPLLGSPLLENFREDTVVKSYTEVLLVPLTTPDFSMPYNVITFTCTVLALYFGSLLNALRRRIGEEERELTKTVCD